MYLPTTVSTPSRVHCRTLTWQLHPSVTSNKQYTPPPLSPSTPPSLTCTFLIHPTLIPYSQAQILLFHFQITWSQPPWNWATILVRDAPVANIRRNTLPRKTCHWCINLRIHQPPIKWGVVVVLAWYMHVINRYCNDNWKMKEVVPIMRVFILVLNLYASSAESQVLILDLILSLISIHLGLLVHNFFSKL